jgi:hypothetical protein
LLSTVTRLTEGLLQNISASSAQRQTGYVKPFQDMARRASRVTQKSIHERGALGGQCKNQSTGSAVRWEGNVKINPQAAWRAWRAM